MPHIAEDRLHAYVDRDRSDITPEEGALIRAHAETCEVCRAVIEEGTMLRERANAILSRSGPARVVVPDFAAIQARAGAPVPAPVAPAPHRSTRRMHPGYVTLAWAASLIAALGLGWLTRDLFQERDQVAIESASDESSAEEAASTMAAPASPASPGGAVAGGASDLSEPPATGGAAGGAVIPQSVAGTAPAAAPTAGSNPAAAGGAGIAAGVAPSLQERAAATRSAVPAEPRPRAAPTGSIPPSTIEARGPAADAVPAAAPAAPGGQVAQAPPPTVREESLRIGAQAAPAAAPQASAPAAWTVTSREEAERRLGRALLSVPDLPTRRIEVLGSGSTTAVRISQIAPDGVVTITETLATNPANPSGQAAVTRRVGDLHLAIEGPLPAEALRAILARVR